MTLVLAEKLWDELIAACRAGLPYEACGYLVGVGGRVTGLVSVANLLADEARGRTAYLMDPVEQVAVVREVEAAGLRPVAIWHSHPLGLGRLSDTDIRFAVDRSLLHVVVGLRDPVPDVRCWQLGSARPTPVDIEYVNT